jgi:hypothetical protein
VSPGRICYAARMRRLALLLAAGSLVACQSDAGPPVGPRPGSGNVKETDADYPSDNVGTAVGNVIPNYCFPGFVDPVASTEQDEICLSNFYNPTGDGTYGSDDPFPDGAPLPKLVVIDVSGKWCSPCKYEAQHVLPGVWSNLGPKGLLLMTVLADGNKPTVPATLTDLAQWSAAFQPRYPNVIDPKYQMGALFDSSQFPAFFIIDARTMEIVQFVGGKPPETFWEKVEELL